VARRRRPEFIGAIEQLFRVRAEDAAKLANELFSRNRRVYEATINAQLQAIGAVPDFRLTNSAELRRLKSEAIESARSIARTYNEGLAARVDAVVAAERTTGLNRGRLARRLADWEGAREPWKDSQIQRTEAARTRAGAVEAWAEGSGLATEARFVLSPASSSHDDANDAAAREGRLLTLEEVRGMSLPKHPNERHSPILAVPTGTDTSALWMGG
jgi:hypothetical protein